jgi:hypothetical protein
MLRRTRKNGQYKQKGGGVWYQLKNIGPISAAIKSTGLSDILNTKTTDIDRQKRLNAYISAIANQDELFTAIHYEYVKQFKPVDATSAAEWVITDKVDIDKDITLKGDIENIALGALTLSKLTDINSSSKLALIKSGKYAPISHMVLYPACLQNMVITGIARLFVALKYDPSTLEAMVREDIKTTEGATRRRTMIEILAAQNVGFIRSLVLMMTQKDIQDGLTLMSEPMNSTLLTEFWEEVLRTIVRNYAVEKSALFKTDAGYVIHDRESDPVMDSISVDHFAFVAGTLFIYYKNERLVDVFENFAKDGKLDKSKDKSYDNIIKYAPPQDHLEIPIPALGDATLGSLLTQMTMEELHFILHLRRAIEREEQAVASD